MRWCVRTLRGSGHAAGGEWLRSLWWWTGARCCICGLVIVGRGRCAAVVRCCCLFCRWWWFDEQDVPDLLRWWLGLLGGGFGWWWFHDGAFNVWWGRRSVGWLLRWYVDCRDVTGWWCFRGRRNRAGDGGRTRVCTRCQGAGHFEQVSSWC